MEIHAKANKLSGTVNWLEGLSSACGQHCMVYDGECLQWVDLDDGLPSKMRQVMLETDRQVLGLRGMAWNETQGMLVLVFAQKIEVYICDGVKSAEFLAAIPATQSGFVGVRWNPKQSPCIVAIFYESKDPLLVAVDKRNRVLSAIRLEESGLRLNEVADRDNPSYHYTCGAWSMDGSWLYVGDNYGNVTGRLVNDSGQVLAYDSKKCRREAIIDIHNHTHKGIVVLTGNSKSHSVRESIALSKSTKTSLHSFGLKEALFNVQIPLMDQNGSLGQNEEGQGILDSLMNIPKPSPSSKFLISDMDDDIDNKNDNEKRSMSVGLITFLPNEAPKTVVDLGEAAKVHPGIVALNHDLIAFMVSKATPNGSPVESIIVWDISKTEKLGEWTRKEGETVRGLQFVNSNRNLMVLFQTVSKEYETCNAESETPEVATKPVLFFNNRKVALYLDSLTISNRQVGPIEHNSNNKEHGLFALLEQMQRTLCERLDHIEAKIDEQSTRLENLENYVYNHK